ncbi:hypothetical protein BJ165DRAFT_1535567 [Panaeolus papilionaceus]|nr:hypothetical protein BJ165DRAFT_1535567 [Panaeolus papilionaceus]
MKGLRHSEVTSTPASQHDGERSTPLNTADNGEAGLGGQGDSQTPIPMADNQESTSLSGEEEPPKKRSQTKSSSTNKLADWLHARDEFLDIILQHEGIPDGSRDPACSNCGVLCQSCSLHQHEHLLFHRIEKWNGTFFVKSSLYKLGLVHQLGHGGCDCPTCAEQASSGDIQMLQVIHTTGVFKLSVRYCKCQPNTAPRYRQLLRERLFPASLRQIRTVFTFEVLDTFHSLNLDGKITSYNYYYHILQKTDFLELREQPSQLNNFNRAIRIWRHMMGLKRTGCAHSLSGALGTELGGTLVECPLCPHPEKNLPGNWDADTSDAFLYTLFVAIDANFKLKQKDHGLDDIELGSGWGAFVEQEPYIKHITAKVDEPENTTQSCVQPLAALPDVRLQFAAEEDAAARSGELPVHKISMSSFLLTGLEIEDQQRLLKDELSESSKLTTRESADFQQKQTALLRWLNSWRDVQKSYMPCVAPLIEEENGSDASKPPPVECAKLFLPSSLPDTLRLTVNRLGNIEACAWVAQADVALEEIRCLLRAKTNLSTFKKLNLTGEGNKVNTRACALYDRLNKKKDNAAARYRSAQDALLKLDPKGDWSFRLLELNEDDMRPLGEHDTLEEGLDDEDHENRKKLKTHHLIPWIWLVIGPNTKKLDEDAELDVTARVQWAKARARALRWEEEVKLIVEEMRRCVAYLEWKVRWWEQHVGLRTEIGSHLQSGLKAYALKQADYAQRLAGACAVYWNPLLCELGFGNEWCLNYIPFTLPSSKASHSGLNTPLTASTKTSIPVTETESNRQSSEAESGSQAETETQGGVLPDIDSDEN